MDNTRSWRAASFVQGCIDLLEMTIIAEAVSRCGVPPLRQKSLYDRVRWVGIPVDRVTSRDVPARRFSLYDRVWRVEIKHLQTLIMHPDSHLWLIRVVAFLRQRAAVQRPGRGRLSVGRHSTAGAPAGRKPLKSRKARRLLHLMSRWSSATLMSL